MHRNGGSHTRGLASTDVILRLLEGIIRLRRSNQKVPLSP